MPSKQPSSGYQKFYAALLGLYPKPYRERFRESMQQTFNDLCHERAHAGGGLFLFVLGACTDTFIGIIDERISSLFSSTSMGKKILKLAVATAFLLLIPVLGNIYVGGWNWDAFDFVFAGALIFGTGLTYVLIAARARTNAYKYALGLSLAASFLLIWVNGAVGIIGNENNPANALFLGVILIGLFGSLIARLRPQGMMRAAFAAAVAQFLVPLIALVIWKPALTQAPGIIGVLMFNMFFVAMWTAAAVLFRKAAQK